MHLRIPGRWQIDSTQMMRQSQWFSSVVCQSAWPKQQISRVPVSPRAVFHPLQFNTHLTANFSVDRTPPFPKELMPSTLFILLRPPIFPQVLWHSARPCQTTKQKFPPEFVCQTDRISIHPCTISIIHLRLRNICTKLTFPLVTLPINGQSPTPHRTRTTSPSWIVINCVEFIQKFEKQCSQPFLLLTLVQIDVRRT